VARHSRAKKTVITDERGAAYYALGLAKASGLPAVLICTSGTAVANYLPAIVEASMDNIPLIVLSADRPPELIRVGANQAIFQDNIYGQYPRWQTTLAPPDSTLKADRVQSMLESMWEHVIGSYPGPVHLNCQFREPFDPQKPTEDTSTQLNALPNSPVSDTTLSASQRRFLKSHLGKDAKGLIVVGRSVDQGFNDSILALAQKLNWPVLPDVQCNLRFREQAQIINHFDLALIREEPSALLPDVVLHLGGAYTSKRLLTFLNNKNIRYISVKATPEKIDPNHQVDLTIQCNLGRFLNEVQTMITTTAGETSVNWMSAWQALNTSVLKGLDDFFVHHTEISEPLVCRIISEIIPSHHTLFLANSMPIRDMEMFGKINTSVNSVIANRGASGIDGLIATSAGMAKSSDKPLTLVIGDLAALHDLNSLALLSASPQPITIVLINNNGGGIFNFLEIADESDIFEPFFGTPHHLQFDKAAQMFNISYLHPKDLADFKAAYSSAVRGEQSVLIEVSTVRSKNHQLHQEIFKYIHDL
jgi:2-succinyl-5-enolpyruvyl-6-hydroxy-3-cyclohexene-1-carboxylate synthase